MRCISLRFLFFLICSPGNAQPAIREYIQNNKVTIRTIDPADTVFDDLETIGKAIGEKRVVLMGEQDHGDAPAFLAKTRIIKYLHERKGFNVIAFESDFFALNEGQKEITDASTLKKFILDNIFQIWTHCDACSDLFYSYLPARRVAGNPLIITGFDNQPHSGYSKRIYRKYLDSILTNSRYPVKDFENRKAQLLRWADTLVSGYGKKYSPSLFYENMNAFLQTLIEYHRLQYENDFNYYLLLSLKTYAEKSHTQGINSLNIRDIQMAANLDWLVNVKYRNQKIVVWAHNYHIMDKSWDAMGHNEGRHYSMGNEFLKNKKNRDQTYVLGFDSKQGKAGRLGVKKHFRVKKPEDGSIENWFGADKFSFIDFTEYNRSVSNPEYFRMKGIYHMANSLAQWTRCFDGIFYIRDMYPCKGLY